MYAEICAQITLVAEKKKARILVKGQLDGVDQRGRRHHRRPDRDQNRRRLSLRRLQCRVPVQRHASHDGDRETVQEVRCVALLGLILLDLKEWDGKAQTSLAGLTCLN